jgi:UDP-glucose 4-epimerase
VFNIGSDQPVSIRELAERVIALSKSRSTVELQTYTAAYDKDFEDVRRRVPDVSRLRTTIDHRPRSDLDGIIRDVIASKRQSVPAVES